MRPAARQLTCRLLGHVWLAHNHRGVRCARCGHTNPDDPTYD